MLGAGSSGSWGHSISDASQRLPFASRTYYSQPWARVVLFGCEDMCSVVREI